MSAALLAGAALGGSIIGAGSQSNTNQANQDFAREMSSTQYQRAVEDMRAAGINPVMAAGTGGASSNGVQNTAPGAQVASGIQNAARLVNETNQAEANVAQQNANTAVANEVGKRTKEETRLVQANTRVQQANAKAIETQQPEREVKAVPYRIGNEYVKGAEAQMKAPATWNKPPEAPKKQNSSKAYEQGKGTVYGGTSSAKQYQDEVQRYNDKQNRGIMKR